MTAISRGADETMSGCQPDASATPGDDMTAQGGLMDDALLTRAEVADLLAVSERTVIRLRSAGAFPAVRIGQQIRFRVADIRAYIERQTESVAAA